MLNITERPQQDDVAVINHPHDKLIVIDVENSHLFDFKLPADDPSQPRLAQLCILAVSKRPTFEVLAGHIAYVKPDGWEMSPGATEVTGITTEYLHEHGLPVGDVLDLYQDYVRQGYGVVAHNVRYDIKQMRGEFRRAGRDDLFEQTPNICTMRTAHPICRIPNRPDPETGKVRGGIKWPSLEEALAHFGIPFEGKQHEAGADAEGCRKLMVKLFELGELPLPQVFYAKDRD